MLDLKSAFSTQPPPLDFVWRGFVAGTVGTVTAAGSTGKSFWAMEAGMGVASAVANESLLNLEIEHNGRVVILNAEDPEQVLLQRLFAIGKFLSPEARDEVAENLVIEPLVGFGVNVMTDKWVDAVCRVGEGARLIILDTHSRWSGGVDENDNAKQSLVLQRYEHIARVTGAAVLFPHHVAKSAARDGSVDSQQAARGAAAIIDNCRWAGWMQTMTPEQAKLFAIPDDQRKSFVAYGGNKENYGAHTAETWYQRKEGGVLLPVDLVVPQKASKGGRRELTE